SPVGGESWVPGERRTITWTGISSNATVRLYTDQVVGSGMIGPYVELAAVVSGASATITVPDVVTARGRIVVTGTGPDHGPALTATHQQPLRVGRETVSKVVRTDLLATYGYAFSSLVHTPAGPQVLAMGDTSGWLRQLRPGSGGKWTNAIVGDCNN